jgi:hypothetical protein
VIKKQLEYCFIGCKATYFDSKDGGQHVLPTEQYPSTKRLGGTPQKTVTSVSTATTSPVPQKGLPYKTAHTTILQKSVTSITSLDRKPGTSLSSDQATGPTNEESWFVSRYRQEIFLPQSVLTGSEAWPTSYSMRNKRSVTEDRVAVAWSWLLTSI